MSLRDQDLYTLQILNELYGGGMSSRLFQEVREKRGLCYSIYSFFNAYDDTGLFGFGAGTSEADVAELVPVALAELEELARKVDPAALARAQAQVKSTVFMGLESLHSRCEWVTRQYDRYGRVLSPAEVIEKINAVTPDRVQGLAQRLLSETALSMSAIGPIGGLPAYDTLAKH